MASARATKVAVIGLDCAEPSLVFDKYRRSAAQPHSPAPARNVGPVAQLRTADHRAGLDVDDVEQRPRHARILRVPQSRRPLV